jgi:hypothetical protein
VDLGVLFEPKHAGLRCDSLSLQRCWGCHPAPVACTPYMGVCSLGCIGRAPSTLYSAHALGIHAPMKGAWAQATCSIPCSWCVGSGSFPEPMLFGSWAQATMPEPMFAGCFFFVFFLRIFLNIFWRIFLGLFYLNPSNV